METRRGFALLLAALAGSLAMAANDDVKRGAAALDSWHDDAPGVRRQLTVNDLGKPLGGTDTEKPDNNFRAKVVARPDGAMPKAPDDVSVAQFAGGFDKPRALRTAPNGDIFLAESGGGRVLVFKADKNGTPSGDKPAEFATGLPKVYGMAFYPPDAPKHLYVATPDTVLRFAYASGDVKARAKPETIISKVPGSHHWTRDLAVAPGGRQLLLAVGSGSNVAGTMRAKTADEIRGIEDKNGLGAAWDDEDRRAALWSFDPDGGNIAMYANGLRNCSGLTVHGESIWCSVNERDGLGDDVPFEYVTTVVKGAFYGWPWYYNGAHEEPRRKGERADLAAKVTLGDVLLQAHSAPLGLAFYDGDRLPAQYRGNLFVALHGSWNRSKRTGYKVVRLPMKDAKPTGEYIDFLTGFVLDDKSVWGRPVGVTVAKDGSLIVSEDGAGTLWRITAK
jgi:glucose/arabinose dehydrogenase